MGTCTVTGQEQLWAEDRTGHRDGHRLAAVA